MSEFLTLAFLGAYMFISAVTLILSIIEIEPKGIYPSVAALMLSPVWIYICKAVQLIG